MYIFINVVVILMNTDLEEKMFCHLDIWTFFSYTEKKNKYKGDGLKISKINLWFYLLN